MDPFYDGLKYEDTRINTAGMFRCCVTSIHVFCVENGNMTNPAIDGTEHKCKYCGDTAVLRNGVWCSK